jgi:hypothetical protein
MQKYGWSTRRHPRSHPGRRGAEGGGQRRRQQGRGDFVSDVGEKAGGTDAAHARRQPLLLLAGVGGRCGRGHSWQSPAPLLGDGIGGLDDLAGYGPADRARAELRPDGCVALSVRASERRVAITVGVGSPPSGTGVRDELCRRDPAEAEQPTSHHVRRPVGAQREAVEPDGGCHAPGDTPYPWPCHQVRREEGGRCVTGGEARPVRLGEPFGGRRPGPSDAAAYDAAYCITAGQVSERRPPSAPHPPDSASSPPRTPPGSPAR